MRLLESCGSILARSKRQKAAAAWRSTGLPRALVRQADSEPFSKHVGQGGEVRTLRF